MVGEKLALPSFSRLDGTDDEFLGLGLAFGQCLGQYAEGFFVVSCRGNPVPLTLETDGSEQSLMLEIHWSEQPQPFTWNHDPYSFAIL